MSLHEMFDVVVQIHENIQISLLNNNYKGVVYGAIAMMHQSKYELVNNS